VLGIVLELENDYIYTETFQAIDEAENLISWRISEDLPPTLLELYPKAAAKLTGTGVYPADVPELLRLCGSTLQEL
jgi:hypothetical protein